MDLLMVFAANEGRVRQTKHLLRNHVQTALEWRAFKLLVHANFEKHASNETERFADVCDVVPVLQWDLLYPCFKVLQ